MKNILLYIAGVIFLIGSLVQFLRFKFGIDLIVGHEHHIPLELSFYVSIAGMVLGVLMLIAGFIKK